MGTQQHSQSTWYTDWKTGFRIGLTGFILAWAITAHGDELAPVPLQSTPDDEEGLPVLITPSETDPDLKIRPGKVVNVDSQPSTESQPEKAWTMIITSGASQVAGTPEQREVVSFERDSESGEIINHPSVKPLGDQQVEAVTAPKQKPHAVQPTQYQAIYNSIPFSRTEYLANPSYRHEATMEMLFGELRPTVIHKEDKPVRVYNHSRLNEGPAAHLNPVPWSWYYPTYGAGSLYWNRYPYWTPNSTYRRYSGNPYGSLYWRYYRPLGH